jgi:hypothetical protein
MHELPPGLANSPDAAQGGKVDVMSRAELVHCRHWRSAFAGQRKDHRFYELVEDTIRQGFDYRYFAIGDTDGEIQAVQPFFIIDQDLLAGTDFTTEAIVQSVRRVRPRFLKMRALMVGCALGEGHLDGSDFSHESNTASLNGGCERNPDVPTRSALLSLRETDSHLLTAKLHSVNLTANGAHT